jgi:hypothetical protein
MGKVAWKGKTLAEVMEQFDGVKLKEGLYFHVSAGTSFVCVIRPEEFTEHIQMVEDWYRDATMASAMENLNHLGSQPSPYKTTFVDVKITFAYALQSDILASSATRENYCHAVEVKLRKLYEFRPYAGRLVTEFYKRIQGDGWVVTVTGSENGRFWDRKEYEEWLNEGKEEESNEN